MENKIFNELQSQLTKKLLDNFDRSTIADIYEAIEQIPLVDTLTNPNRKRISELEKDPKGRIIVDITDMHILEDMQYFRKAAAHFEEFGTYTNLYPNKNPNSEYIKFWKEEARRCREGYVRESDGEWIPGDFYFYLNYSPIMVTVGIEEEDKNLGEFAEADRVEGFPYIYDGDYMYYHYLEQARRKGHHGFVLKSRGKGFSFKGGSGLAKRAILGENTRSQKNVKAFALANEKEYLTKDGVMNKFVDVIDFLGTNTPWPRRRELKDSIGNMHWKLGYKDPLTGIEKGIKNEVMGVTLKDDPQKARGKRGTYILWEEVGKFRSFIQAWGIARPSVEDGNFAFGTMIAYGTGGTEGADFEGAEQAFYNPLGHNIYGIKNIFDKNASSALCSFFFPEYLNRSGCYDENGNSDVIKALLQLFSARNKIKFGTSDPNILIQEKAERPITPQEAIMRKEGSIFPVLDLKEMLADIEPKRSSFIAPHYVGRLFNTPDGGVNWKPDANVNILRNYPIDKSISKVGGIEIFEQPVNGPRGIPPHGVYIAGTDPVDDDHSSTDSVCCTYIMNVMTDRIVAEYTSREHTAEQYYENTLRLLKYYNAQCNYENDKKGMFAYFKKKHALHYLVDTPEILRDMDMVKGSNYGNKAHPYSEKVYTPKGIKKWKDISIGDVLYNSYGGTTKVIDIPFDDSCEIFTITLKDGRSVKASSNHLWEVIDWNGYKKIVTTTDIKNDLGRNKGKYFEYKYYIPKNLGVDFSEKKLPIEPYLLGLMEGDGCFTQSKHHNLNFTSSKEDMQEYIKMLDLDVHLKDDRHYSIRFKNAGKILKQLNLLDKKKTTKFIPDCYKYSSRKQRLELLRGLLDSDGTVGYGGNPEFVNISKKLVEDTIEVARSLGINCNMNTVKNQHGTYYKIRFYTSIRLFNLKRKSSKQKLTKTRNKKTAIISVKYSHKENSKCVTVDSKDSCYLIGDFVKTHNSKGTNSGKRINEWGRRLTADWMLSPSYTTDPEEEPVANMFKIRSIGLIKEAIAWNPDGNFDRISAIGMLMILREERINRVPTYEEKKTGDMGDEFFNKWFQNNTGSNVPVRNGQILGGRFNLI